MLNEDTLDNEVTYDDCRLVNRVSNTGNSSVAPVFYQPFFESGEGSCLDFFPKFGELCVASNFKVGVFPNMGI